MILLSDLHVLNIFNLCFIVYLENAVMRGIIIHHQLKVCII